MDLRYTKTFTLLQQEGSLAKTMLLQGFDSLTKANLDPESKGNFYNGFFNISIGAERLLKICSIINHLINNELSPPSNTDLKIIGHNITALYERLIKCSQPFFSIDSPIGIERDLLEFLTEFAKSSRYYNLDALSEGKPSTDPISACYELLLRCWDDEVRNFRKQRIIDKLVQDLDASGMVGYMSEFGFDDHPMTTVDFYLRMTIVEKTTPMLIYHVINLLRPAYDYLSAVCGTAAFRSDADCPSIPYMYEFFVFLLSSRSDALRTKAWSRLF
jgi:hypothetical protein